MYICDFHIYSWPITQTFMLFCFVFCHSVQEQIGNRWFRVFTRSCLSTFKYISVILDLQVDRKTNFEPFLPASSVTDFKKCAGFSTASGKTIKVDEKSLLRVQKLFDDLPANCVLEENAGN